VRRFPFPEGRGAFRFIRSSGAVGFAGKTDVFLYEPEAELWTPRAKEGSVAKRGPPS